MRHQENLRVKLKLLQRDSQMKNEDILQIGAKKKRESLTFSEMSKNLRK